LKKDEEPGVKENGAMDRQNTPKIVAAQKLPLMQRKPSFPSEKILVPLHYG